ncbi:MAG: cation:proton antiporter [Calditrichia bacterium]
MAENYLVQLAVIIVFGVVSQMIAWRLRLPSILLLLIAGFVAGPLTGWVHPDEVFGKLLFPLVSISVAVILYEGGLNLRLSELKAVGKVIRNLISIGILVTWILSTAAALLILGLSLPLSMLLGAILVVTGPTVILPLLRQIRPSGQMNSILKWEGMINDPIGALLAVLVFEGTLASGLGEATAAILGGLLKTIFFGSLIGILGAYTFIFLLKRQLIPDYLQNPVSLMMVFIVFASSNVIQPESGLFSVTLLGIFLANQKKVTVHHIIEFKENLRVLLISVLFIVLAARINIADLKMLDWRSFVFLASLIFLIRPAAVYSSTIGSSLSRREKSFLCWMAPRGIVAAAVSSLFALEMERAGIPEAGILVPLTFLVIIGTIAIYGFTAMPVAKWLGIAKPNPQGCLILGAYPFARAIARSLKSNGIRVLLIDTNWQNISAARMEGLPTYYGSILSEYIFDDIDLTGIGKLLALSANEEVNSLAALYFSKTFGTNEVFQLSVEENEEQQSKVLSKDLRGNILFGLNHTYSYLFERFGTDSTVKAMNITDRFREDIFRKHAESHNIIPLFLITDNKKLVIYTSESGPVPKPGQKLISLVNEKVKVDLHQSERIEPGPDVAIEDEAN